MPSFLKKPHQTTAGVKKLIKEAETHQTSQAALCSNTSNDSPALSHFKSGMIGSVKDCKGSVSL